MELSLSKIRKEKELIENLTFEITTIDLKKNQYGKNDLLISKVKVMDADGKYIKFAQINDELLKALKTKGAIKIK